MAPVRKLVVQMSGAPGSGKSTVASLLARSIDGVVLNHDLVKSFFLDNGMSFEQASRLTYGLDWVLAEDILKQGRSIVVDSPCNYQEHLDRGSALARQHDCDYRYVECRVDNMDLLDRRLRDRVPMRCQRTGVDAPPPDLGGPAPVEKDAQALFQRWMKTPCRPETGVITVDSTTSPEECVDEILKRIAAVASDDVTDTT